MDAVARAIPIDLQIPAPAEGCHALDAHTAEPAGKRGRQLERLSIRRHLESDVPFIQSAGEYISAGGGKRMRPALLLLSSRMLGHDSEEEVTYAAVVEFIHTATLIHDDIIDHASLRRGQRTVNQVWGNSMTVLLGDWIYTTSMRMALAHDNLEVIRRLCDATLRMTEGELLGHQLAEDK